MKFYVFTDLHLHKFSDYSRSEGPYNNTRLEAQVNALEDIINKAGDDHGVVLFLGDLFHQRGKVDTEVYNAGVRAIADRPEVPIYMLEGNHDNVSNSIHSASSLEPLSYLPNVTLIKEYEKFNIGETSFVGLSYGEEYEELKTFLKNNTADVLLGHLGVEGANGAGMSKLSGAFTTGDLLVPSHYSLALLGHYHKRQELAKNVFYVGNPVAQDFGDSGMRKGYMTFETDSTGVIQDSIQFHVLEYPMFIKVDKDNVQDYEGVDLEGLAEYNFVRVVLDAETFKQVRLTEDLDDRPTNLQIEKQAIVTSESRLNIKDTSSVEEIARAWSKEFQPQNEELIIKQLQKVL